MVSVEVPNPMLHDIVLSAKRLLLLLLRSKQACGAGMASLAGLKASLAQGAQNRSPPLQCNAYEAARHAHNTMLALLLPFAVLSKDVCRHAAHICFLSPHKQARAKTSEDVDHLPSHPNNISHNSPVDYPRHGAVCYDATLSSHTNLQPFRCRLGERGSSLGEVYNMLENVPSRCKRTVEEEGYHGQGRIALTIDQNTITHYRVSEPTKTEHGFEPHVGSIFFYFLHYNDHQMP